MNQSQDSETSRLDSITSSHNNEHENPAGKDLQILVPINPVVGLKTAAGELPGTATGSRVVLVKVEVSDHQGCRKVVSG